MRTRVRLPLANYTHYTDVAQLRPCIHTLSLPPYAYGISQNHNECQCGQSSLGMVVSKAALESRTRHGKGYHMSERDLILSFCPNLSAALRWRWPEQPGASFDSCLTTGFHLSKATPIPTLQGFCSSLKDCGGRRMGIRRSRTCDLITCD